MRTDLNARRHLSDAIAKRIDRVRAVKWFLGLTFPYVFVASLVLGWRNNAVPEPNGLELTIRSSLLAAGFISVFAIFYFVIIRPVILAFNDEIDTTGANDSGNPRLPEQH
ncbi:preprotein translocase subunit YajC [Aporhodopirellula aestuarii]|uniref:DUF485 domain-containing protein n=1 Tax=Aporhodopirellula aestuarii TaxID=2950107 RepID=A0ABT0TY33_9BACT|nr:hypothetical protein [Aporhodopirellula aestuarii]MCM2369508.1 hypothetical protein [Aporhodopirellula aestuarii]